VETYTTISAKAAAGHYGNGNAAFWFGWAPPLAGPDPSRYLIETYAPGSANAKLSGFDAPFAAAFASLALEFDLDRRAEQARGLSAQLLEAGGGGLLPWLLQRSEVFRWPYLVAAPATPFWEQQLDASTALDSADPSFVGRP
jgi:hypothetical protein